MNIQIPIHAYNYYYVDSMKLQLILNLLKVGLTTGL